MGQGSGHGKHTPSDVEPSAETLDVDKDDSNVLVASDFATVVESVSVSVAVDRSVVSVGRVDF